MQNSFVHTSNILHSTSENLSKKTKKQKTKTKTQSKSAWIENIIKATFLTETLRKQGTPLQQVNVYQC
jgi:hypothetical protein